ncbi:MAG: hypothetical protein GYB68_18900, partial [Chloroflexi bacterium]|nr:hypothetical protein [Chloroflexota bacterium]
LAAVLDAFNPEGGQRRPDWVLFDPQTGEERLRTTSSPGIGSAIAFSPDAANVVIGTSGSLGSVLIYDTEIGNPIAEIEGESGRSQLNLAWTPDGSTIVVVSEAGVILWDAETLEPLGQVRAVSSARQPPLSLSPDGRFVAAVDGDSTVFVLDLNSREVVASFEGHVTQVTTLAFSPDGRWLASGAVDGTILLWPLP